MPSRQPPTGDFDTDLTQLLPRLRVYALSLTRDSVRADDLVQQTITTLYVKWRRARAADNLDAYVRTMLVRTFLDEKRLAWARVRLFREIQIELEVARLGNGQRHFRRLSCA